MKPRSTLNTFSPVFIVVPFLTGAAIAQSVWNPNPVNGNWNNPDNWTALPVSNSRETVLTFGASTVTSLNDDFAGFFTLNSLNFTASAPAFTLSNNGLDFRSTQGGVRPAIGMDTASDVTLNGVVQFGSDLTIQGAGTGKLTFGGNLVGLAGNSLTMASAGTVSFAGPTNWVGGYFTVKKGTASITGGSTLSTARSGTAYTAMIGDSTGDNGTVDIGGGTGTSTWNNNGAILVVGNSGTGTLNATGASVVSSGSGSIGEWGTGIGNANIGGGTGTSSWSNTGNLFVGNRGTGNLNITAGGSVDNQVGIVGNESTGSGSATVGGGTGSSTWTNRAHLVVGQSGAGSLAITGGGTATNTVGYIAYDPGSSGDVTVGGGTGSATWTNSSHLSVGNHGDATLTITGGGSVSNTFGYIAEKADGSGVVNVGGGTGSSTWTNSDVLYVGTYGSGELSITGGGTVFSDAGILADSTGGHGSVTVGGGVGASAWTNTRHLVVGQVGNADMTITGGGTVSNTMGFIAYGDGTTASVTVGGGTGTSTWVNSGTLSVGYSGAATLTINTGGIVRTAGLEGGNSQSSIRLNGGTLAISASNTSSNRIELQSGGGTVQSMGASIVVMNGTISGPGHLTKTGSGVLQLTGNNTYQGGTTLKAGGSTVVTSPNALGTGTVTVEAGASLSYNNAANLAAPVTLAGGSYNRFISTSTTLANRINATSSFSGGAADTEARILAGTASMNLTMLSSFAPDSSATNDFLRKSDVYDLGFLPATGPGTGIGTVGYVLQLSTGALMEGAYLGWLDTSTNAWVNAVTGNIGEPSSHAGSPFTSGTFADFQALYGTNVSNYMGAWGSYEANGVTTTWAVLNHNSSFAIIPEPTPGLLAGLGLGSAALLRRRRMKA